jgi:hypothetical protein
VNLSVAVQNPGGSLSNAATFIVVAAETNGADTILLTHDAPNVTGKDITVVDLSTTGSSVPSQNISLNVVSVSPFQPATGNCTLAGGPVPLVRPASGMATAHLCAFSVGGLDPSLTYTLTGPSPNDIIIVGKEPLGLGIVHLTLAVPSTAQAGARTLFIQNANRDLTAATGAVEVR